ncbi:MAG: DUF3050 domain-containing protein [Bacteroidota bacterium]
MKTELPAEIHAIRTSIEPLRKQLVEHPLYASINSLDDLQIFMEHHMFAVWDFMSILKALQNELTCTSIPWVPKGTPALRRLINEIVHGEESDEDKSGRAASHYELYHEAMKLAGADTSVIDGVLADIMSGSTVSQAMAKANIPDSVKQFVAFSFETIDSKKTHNIAAIFTFGREDLIPDMFTALVKDLSAKFPGKLDALVYYLERHIELDGGEHGPLALTMIAELCGNDPQKWAEALEASNKALEVRIALWDGILEEVKANQLV